MYAVTSPLQALQDEILVIDDDSEVREALCDVLTDEGFTVERAVHGADALAKLRAFRPALIVLDLTMPVMDGYEFLERRAKDQRLLRIPVIVVSATIDAHIRQPGVQVVRKPIDLDTLLGIVQRQLGG